MDGKYRIVIQEKRHALSGRVSYAGIIQESLKNDRWKERLRFHSDYEWEVTSKTKQFLEILKQ